jgi:site-specific DNA recombinase
MSQNVYDVQNVALYLRKSRGDEEVDLSKHRDELVSMCEKNDWAYVEYAEIGTGDRIDVRPKMQELLQDVELEMYDAVLVVHYDRLGRGDKIDQATIEKTFAMSDTLIITPQKVYNLNDESDMMLADFQGMIARQEYKQIARRLRQGKARGAKLGNWSNGKPPFPYVYDRQTKKAKVDPQQVEIYRMMIDWALSGWSSTDIAWELNKLTIPSPRDGLWSPPVVHRLLLDEVHLGHIVVGKKRKLVTTGAIVSKPKEEWIVYKNCHPAVKTEVEHHKLQFLFQREKRTPPASRAGKNAFSGIVKCGKCGHSLQMQKRPDRPCDYLKSCTFRDYVGTRCTNVGGSLSLIEKAVGEAIERKQKELEEAIRKGIHLEDRPVLYELLEEKLAQIKKIENRISHLTDMRADGEITKEEYVAKKAEYESQLLQWEEEYKVIQKQIDHTEQARNEDMLATVKDVMHVLQQEKDAKTLNRAYKSIIHDITWHRDQIDEKPRITVNFL